MKMAETEGNLSWDTYRWCPSPTGIPILCKNVRLVILALTVLPSSSLTYLDMFGIFMCSWFCSSLCKPLKSQPPNSSKSSLSSFLVCILMHWLLCLTDSTITWSVLLFVWLNIRRHNEANQGMHWVIFKSKQMNETVVSIRVLLVTIIKECSWHIIDIY